jgi:DNA-binding CsgD family transcriptional regulator
MVRKGRKVDGKEYRALRKDGSELAIIVQARPIYQHGRISGIRSTLTDITPIKGTEEALRQREKQLEAKTKGLDEVNTALTVLLKRKDEDREELEEKVVANVRQLVLPLVEEVKKRGLDPEQMAYMDVLASNLRGIISPFARTLSGKYLSLSPTEIHVANLIKEGRASKEIARLMSLSARTIEFHRESIRKKLGIRNRKTNLRTHLLSL